MAKPGTVPTWATDTNIATGTETGTPTKVAPSAGFVAQGLVPGDTFVGPYFNYLLNLITTWIAYLNLSGTDEITYANTRTRTVLIPASAGYNSTTAVFAYPAADSRGWVASNDEGIVQSDPLATGGTSYLNVPLKLPQGAVLTGVRAAVFSAGSPFLTMKVTRSAFNTATSGASVATNLGTDTAVAGADLLAITGLSETVSASNNLTVGFTSTNTAGGDIVRWIEVTYTETRASGSN